MLTDLLFIALFFITRIGLPIVITYAIGIGIERALTRGTRAGASRVTRVEHPARSAHLPISTL